MPPSSPTVADAVAALRALGVARVDAGPDAGRPLRGVAPDRDARAGDLSWLSPGALAAEPGRVAAFGGAFVVLPTGAAEPPSAFAITESPRLVFSRLVAALFPERLRTRWPADGVAPDARLPDGWVPAPGVVIGPGVTVGEGSTVGPNTVLAHTTLGRGVAVGPGCTLGTDGFGYTRDADGVLVPFPHLGRVVLDDGVTVGANTCIDRGALGETRVGARTRVDNLVHIAHNVTIGRDCAVIARAMIAGGVTVGDGAWIAPSASVLNQLTVGAGATVGLGAVVIRDVSPGATVVGNPARELPR